jgi:hypothetical protein
MLLDVGVLSNVLATASAKSTHDVIAATVHAVILSAGFGLTSCSDDKQVRVWRHLWSMDRG